MRAIQCLVLLLCAAVPAVSAQRKMTDREIVAAVENALASGGGSAYDLADVSVESGTVMLGGRVGDLAAKLRASDLSATIRGVCGVTNNMVVRTSERPDTEIREDIKAALSNDPCFRRRDVKVNVKSGIAVLSGAVSSYPEKEMVRRIAARVRGLRDVIDTISLERAVSRPDGEIERDISGRIRSDVWMQGRTVAVRVKDGAVTLAGAVGTPFERERVSSLSWVSGVFAVDAGSVAVTGFLPAERRAATGAAFADTRIAAAVRDSFRHEPRLAAFDPRIEVANGVVTLSGTVYDLRARQAAEEDAKDIVGVVRVVNRIKVRPESIPEDEFLAASVKYILSSDASLCRCDIAVTAVNGIVCLRGTVDTPHDRALAGAVASGIGGVVRVENALDIFKARAGKSDAQIEEDMAGLMKASLFLAGEDISVSVVDGKMTLRGTVRSRAVMDKVEEMGYEAGAAFLRDQVQVRPSVRHSP